MNLAERIAKRFRRQHRRPRRQALSHPELRANSDDATRSDRPRPPGVTLVYVPRTEEEGQRRAKRAMDLAQKGDPFLRLPGNPGDQEIVFHTSKGTAVPAGAVEMVYNDMLLIDAVSDNGKDGPLYEDTCNPEMLEVLRYARKAYGNPHSKRQ